MSEHARAQPNPFVGPRPFQPGERLYGRNAEGRNLLHLLVAERIVLLYSPSGAGKTSLIQSRLVPILRARKFRVLPPVRVSLPSLDLSGNRYLLSVLQTLETAFPDDPMSATVLAEMTLGGYLDIRFPASGTPDAPDATRNQTTDLVLIFDQFEEILTLDPTDRAHKEEFFVQVGALLASRHIWALFAMREEFIAGLDPYARHVPTRFANTFRLELLNVTAALDAIRGPARTAGVDFTPAAAMKLVDDLRSVRLQQPDGTLLTALGPYVEPVQIQVVCRRLWQNLDPAATVIHESDVAAIGDVDTALRRYYRETVDAVAQATGVRARQIRDWVDRRLITTQGIRGQVLQDAHVSEGLDNRAIWPLVDAHLVRAESHRGATWFELAHDRLIEPVRSDNAAWRETNLSLLQRQAALWEEESRPPSLLLADDELADGKTWAAAHDGEMEEYERQFLAFSVAAQRAAEVRRRIFATMVVLTVLALTLGALATIFFLNAEKNRREAERQYQQASRNESRWWSEHALEQLTVDPVAALHLAVAASPAETAPRPWIPQAEMALNQTLRSSAERVFVQAVSAPLTAGRIAFQGDNVVAGPIAVGADRLLLVAPDLSRVTTVTVGGPVLRQVSWRDDHETLLTYAWEGTGDLTVWWNDQIQATRTLDAPLTCAAWQPNGSFVAVCADTGVELWNPADNATVTLLRSAPESLGRTTKAVWSADGRWLAAWQDRVDRHDRAEALVIAHMPVGPAPLSSSLPAAAVSLPGGIRAASWSPGPEPGLVTVSSTGVLAIRSFITRDTITRTAVMTRSLDARLDGVAFVDATRFVIWGKGAQGDLSFWTLDGNREDVAGGPLEDIDGVSVAPDMRHLVAFHGDGHATVVDLESMEVIAALWGHQRPIGAAAWHPQWPVIATAAGDGTARIWSLDGPALGVLTGHVNADAQVALVDVVAVRWQSDGRHLVTAGEDGSLRMWEVFGQDGYPYCAGGQDTGLPFCFGFSQVADDQTGSFEQLVWRDDLLVTTAWDGAIHGYRPRTGGGWSHEAIAPGGDEIDQVLLNSQGTLALVQLHTGAAHVLDLATGASVLTVDPPVTKGIWLERELLLNHEEGAFTVYDLATWQARAGRDPTGAAITAAALAPDGRLATGHLDGRTLIWQVGDQDELILLLEIPPFAHGDGDPARLPITWMTWLRDGLGVISVGETVSLWDATNGDLRWSYLEPATKPTVAQVDPVGAHLAVARNRSLTVLEAATGVELWQRVASGDIIQGVQWLTAPVWPTAVTGVQPDRSVTNGGAPTDRSLLLIWAGDGTARVWQWRNDAEILVLAQDDPLALAAASAAGKHIATTYTTFTDSGVMDILRIWETWLDAPEDGVTAAREQLTRPLQPDQRREFALGD